MDTKVWLYRLCLGYLLLLCIYDVIVLHAWSEILSNTLRKKEADLIPCAYHHFIFHSQRPGFSLGKIYRFVFAYGARKSLFPCGYRYYDPVLFLWFVGRIEKKELAALPLIGKFYRNKSTGAILKSNSPVGANVEDAESRPTLPRETQP